MKPIQILIAFGAILALGCNKNSDQVVSESEAEVPSFDTTIWTDQTELFVEFQTLVVGETSTFAAHFTDLDGHQAVQEGALSVTLKGSNTEISNRVESPASPGIFTPTIQPDKPGMFQLTFELIRGGNTEQIVIPNVPVYGSNEEAINSAVEQDDHGIVFLKEQSWKIDFQTELVREDSLFEVISTTGTWRTVPTSMEVVVATTSGIVQLTKGFTEGMQIRSGEHIALIGSDEMSNDNQNSAIQQAQADWEKARLEFERKQELFEAKVISAAVFEEAQKQYRIAKSAYETISAGYTAGGKRVKSPLNGVLRNIHIENGDYVKQGDPLFTLSAQTSNLLEVQVSQQYAERLKNIQNLWYQPRTGAWSEMDKTGGQVMSISKKVDGSHPMISVFAKVHDAVEMPEGSFTRAMVATGDPRSGLVIPSSALLEEYGNYSVIVQLGGERFEKRPVKLGRRNGSNVEVLDGLSMDEMIVSTGAYQVKMASMSGQVPAHGHAH